MKPFLATFAASTLFLLLGGSGAWAQAGITVTVNGAPISFAGVPPVEKFGSVLVPLRGVFEKLGANVQYDAPSKAILATRGQTTVFLRLGASQAQVNGVPRPLSVPAQETLGTTLVPLRFVSEALGANVAWVDATQTVVISTNGIFGTGAPVVQSLVLDGGANRPLRAGENLSVTMTGTPGATRAVFSVLGAQSGQGAALRETSPGVYQGTLTFPAGTEVTGASVVGWLTANGTTSPLFQSHQTVRVDTVGPTIGSVAPQDNARIVPGTPLLYGTFSDIGTGVDKNNTHLFVNGSEARAATITESYFSYRPAMDLPQGRNTALLVVRDRAGNETRREWAFDVASDASPIRSVSVAPPGTTFKEGDMVAVRIVATPGGSARFGIGSTIANIGLRESPAGVYTGSYTVRRGDTLSNAPITVYFTTPGGWTVTQTAERSITIAAGRPLRPLIAFPTNNAAVGEGARISGNAAPGATVRVSLAYTGNLLDVPITGAMMTRDVKTDAYGRWITPSVNLETPFGVRALRYTVRATTLGPAGETSETTTVTFRKR